LDQVYLGRTRTITRQSALFGELTYSLTPKLDVTAGGRWFRINTELTRRADGLFNGGLSNDFSKGSETGFSPKGSVSYKLTEHDLVYVSANKGFRPGGGNGFVPTNNCAFDLATLGLSNAPSTYKSDSLWNYEIGSKNSFLDGQMVVNASGYYIDWKNIQQSVSLPNCGFAFIGNVGAAKVKGAEVELKFAVIRGLTLATSATYADAYLTQSAPGTQGQPGDPILSSPKLVVTASTDYRLSVASERVGFVHLDYQWHGSQTQ